ncbi:coiled-coil domain-containing protein 138 isoform X2 [Denticeps clupeoides]|nr:coiled-coil domain-containing protein 138 isoform X2 [Denticeps clupeoides]
MPNPECPPTSESIDEDIQSFDHALEELYKAVSNYPSQLDLADLSDDLDVDLHNEGTEADLEPNILSTDADVTLPSNFVRTSRCSSPEPTGFRREGMQEKHENSLNITFSLRGLGQVHQEMLKISEKLQLERKNQKQWAEELQERERQVEQREKSGFHHHDALLKISGLEEAVHHHIEALQEKHQREVSHLGVALKEKTKEIRRMKSSLDTMKELNDSLKKQLADVNEENKKLESHSRKVQARLENLQRKHEFSMAHKGRDAICSKVPESKIVKQEKPCSSGKQAKGPSHSSSLKLVVLLTDWVLDSNVARPGEGGGPWSLTPPPPPCSLHEKCSQALPVLAELFHQTTEAESVLHLPLLKFVHWSLSQLDHGGQHAVLTSTLRRLGEEMFRGPTNPNTSRKSRSCPLFKSPCLHTRLLATLIILRTISQVDTVAQALDVLLCAVRLEEGRALFLQYQALPALLAILRGGSPGLLALVIDVFMQMCAESWLLSHFLEACGSEDFFRSVTPLLRGSRLEVPQVEKLSMLLEKLSDVRKNKRLFEASGLHLLLQEMHRTADPSYTFLSFNLSSILFNLGQRP